LDPATNDIVYQKDIDALCLLNKMDLIPAGEAGYTSGTLMDVFAEKLVSLETTTNEFWMTRWLLFPSVVDTCATWIVFMYALYHATTLN
jgi:hypothetical protein